MIAQVSGNHRLDSNKAERARAQAAGAEVASNVLEGKPVGPLRVWPGGLAMSRSLGDYPVRATQGLNAGLSRVLPNQPARTAGDLLAKGFECRAGRSPAAQGFEHRLSRMLGD